MNFNKLFLMQEELDSHIEEKHGLAGEDLFGRKVLALLVELGELANETRCFKFWSVKPASGKDIILEEFVDGIHFMLSLGLECSYEKGSVPQLAFAAEAEGTANSQFLKVYESVLAFQASREEKEYWDMFAGYLTLASIMGISEEEIQQAYCRKNEINYERQQKGY
ncbi:dUTP diphosphatase [Mesobacillus zeae]|uniref:dUTPase n=1 Tax=Mesobacillus zeae TaxID=1917180 RepID=A0A398B5G8_9BACI|nr:dUTP diphosphatase [Mesobacillus zeae]RID83190.1 dUTPase [Mesobacillus zeae]